MKKYILLVIVVTSFILANAQYSIEKFETPKFENVESIFFLSDDSYMVESETSLGTKLSLVEDNEVQRSTIVNLMGNTREIVERFTSNEGVNFLFTNIKSKVVFLNELKQTYFIQHFDSNLEDTVGLMVKIEIDEKYHFLKLVQSADNNTLALVFYKNVKGSRTQFLSVFINQDWEIEAEKTLLMENAVDYQTHDYHLTNEGELFMLTNKFIKQSKREVKVHKISKSETKTYTSLIYEPLLGAKIMSDDRGVRIHSVFQGKSWNVNVAQYGLDEQKATLFRMESSPMVDFNFKAFGPMFHDVTVDIKTLDDGSVVGFFKLNFIYSNGGGFASPAIGTPMAMGGTGGTGWTDGTNTTPTFYSGGDMVMDFGVYKINPDGQFAWLTRVERGSPQSLIISNNKLYIVCGDNEVQYDSSGNFIGPKKYALSNKNIMGMVQVELTTGAFTRALLDINLFPKNKMLSSDFLRFDELKKSLFYLANDGEVGEIKFE